MRAARTTSAMSFGVRPESRNESSMGIRSRAESSMGGTRSGTSMDMGSTYDAEREDSEDREDDLEDDEEDFEHAFQYSQSARKRRGSVDSVGDIFERRPESRDFLNPQGPHSNGTNSNRRTQTRVRRVNRVRRTKKSRAARPHTAHVPSVPPTPPPQQQQQQPPKIQITKDLPPTADIADCTTKEATPNNPTVVFVVGPDGSGKKTQCKFLESHPSLQNFVCLNLETLLKKQQLLDLQRYFSSTF